MFLAYQSDVVEQCHARFVGAQFGQIQQRVESEAGRITCIASLHHQHHHHRHQQQQCLPITVPEAYLQVDIRRTGAKPGQHTAAGR